MPTLSLTGVKLQQRHETILVKNHGNLPLSQYFCLFSKEGVPLELGTSAGDQKCEWWGNWADKKFDNN